jgi:SAM-dependent methyltransferase
MSRIEASVVAADTSERNAAFWNELCGTQLARQLGISDSSPESLKKFDDWYFDFYPYLFDVIPFAELAGRDVLEVGLGYGTVAQRLAEARANYTGLDIAAGPVGMANLRLSRLGLPETARQGSILAPAFESGSFDAIVAIGCLHHTGDLALAMDRCRDLLRAGGRLIMMVYYAYSYRRWFSAAPATARYLSQELGGYRGVVETTNAAQRGAYDLNSSGDAAPHTDWISKRSIKTLCAGFSEVTCTIRNIDSDFLRIPRRMLVNGPLPYAIGLDLYLTAVK